MTTTKSWRSAVVGMGAAAALTLARPPLAPAQGAGLADVICTGVAVAVRYDLDVADVSCGNLIGGISVFAVRGATSRTASHMLAVASVARASQKELYLRYRTMPDTVPGCSTYCRELIWIADWNY